jgi:hypothetical protein
MKALLDSQFYTVLLSSKLVLVRRTLHAFPSITECEQAHEEVGKALDGLSRRNFALLVDLRKAPGRNDPEFEQAMIACRLRILSGFRAAAALVRTAAGMMQVTRHLRQDNLNVSVFDDEKEALDFLGVAGSQTH